MEAVKLKRRKFIKNVTLTGVAVALPVATLAKMSRAEYLNAILPGIDMMFDEDV